MKKILFILLLSVIIMSCEKIIINTYSDCNCDTTYIIDTNHNINIINTILFKDFSDGNIVSGGFLLNPVGIDLFHIGQSWQIVQSSYTPSKFYLEIDNTNERIVTNYVTPFIDLTDYPNSYLKIELFRSYGTEIPITIKYRTKNSEWLDLYNMLAPGDTFHTLSILIPNNTKDTQFAICFDNTNADDYADAFYNIFEIMIIQ